VPRPVAEPVTQQGPRSPTKSGRHALAVELVTKAAKAPDERTGAAIDAGITSLVAMTVTAAEALGALQPRLQFGLQFIPVRPSSREYAHAI
jgi:hypothetical protein